MRNQFNFHILLVLSIDTSIHEEEIYMILFSMKVETFHFNQGESI
jgi:hypothetical protein